MIDYEVTYILRPNLEEAEVEERSNAIAETLKNNGGTVLNIERLGKKRLAYEINDVRDGIYVIMRFQSEAAASKELERQLTLNENVMRSLFVKLDKHALAAEKVAPVPVPATATSNGPLTPPTRTSPPLQANEPE